MLEVRLNNLLVDLLQTVLAFPVLDEAELRQDFYYVVLVDERRFLQLLDRVYVLVCRRVEQRFQQHVCPVGSVNYLAQVRERAFRSLYFILLRAQEVTQLYQESSVAPLLVRREHENASQIEPCFRAFLF